MRIVSRIAKRGMDPLVLEGVPIDSTMVAGERGKGATARADQVLQARGMWITTSRLGEGVPQTLGLQIKVMATKGVMMI
jgi:hypothetical protein